MLASVSFRPFNLNFWLRAVAGLACLTFAGAVRAEEDARDIEVVPFRNISTGTNFDQLPQNSSENFKIWQPTAPNSVARSSPQARPGQLPRPQQPSLSKEEQQLIERRRNWVFMQPEDYATMDPKTGKSPFGDDTGNDDKLTAMERYYHRLEQSGKSATTNEFSRLNPERMTTATNSLGVTLPNKDAGAFGVTPFNGTPEAGIFQPMTTADMANVFGNSAAKLSPEEVRLLAEQKSRMESFKQLWDIDQANSAATPVVAPSSGAIDSAPLFGASTPGMPSPFRPAMPGASSSSSKSAAPTAQTVVPPRHTTPPHSDFTPVPRAF
jgi:hypothetical protein